MLFEDNFASKQASEAKGWTFRADGQVEPAWSANQLAASVKANSGLLWGFASGDYADLGLEAEMQFTSGASSATSLIFRYSEAAGKRSYYSFGINTAGEYFLDRMVNGISQRLVNSTRSTLIKSGQGRNTLGVIATGSSLALYINRTLVKTVTDTMLPAKGKAGFIVYSDKAPAVVTYSRFTIYAPDQARQAWSPVAAATATPTTAPVTAGSTPSTAAVDGEKMALAVHPGYKRFTTSYADFSINIPDSWQSLAEEAKGRQIVLGSQGSKTNLEIGISAAGQDLDQVLYNWIQTMKSQVAVPASKTAVGHYAARQVVVDVAETGRRYYLAAVGAPNNTFVLALGGPANDPEVSIHFAAAIASFRVPARCGAAVCPELLQRDAVVGTPAPPPMPAAAPATGGRTTATTPTPAGDYTPQGPGSGTFTAFTFAAGSTKDYRPVDPLARFPEGVTSVFAVYTYEGMKRGTPFVFDWYRDGQVYLKGAAGAWDSDESGGGWRRMYNPDGLPAGNYELRLYVSDQLRQQGSFKVEARPAGKPAIGRILFAEGVKDDQPLGAHKPFENFVAGTKTVYAFFDASNLSKSVSYKREWYRDGALLTSKTEAWAGGANEKNWWANYANDQGLASGTYELKLYLDNELVQLATFVIDQ